MPRPRKRPTSLLTPDEITSLVEVHCTVPHSLLGAHPLGAGKGVVIRAFRPDARSVEVIPLYEADAPVAMTRIHDAGLFEVVFPDREEVFGYRLRATYGPDAVFEFRDPYSFLPTLGDMDLHLAGEGRHEELYDRMGAHLRDLGGCRGVAFTVWAPTARRVSVVGDWNGWDGRIHMMRSLGASGIWEIFIPDLEAGPLYRFEMITADERLQLRSDPLAFAAELRPGVASRIATLDGYSWEDGEWMRARRAGDAMQGPLSVYELHLGSWKRRTGEGHRWLTYRELADELIPYVKDLGFTHIELLPVAEHPFDGSWGYQVTGYFAPTSRFGTPDDFMHFVDRCHQAGIGVIVDWVPAHFPRDEFALARFDGTQLYEHSDPRQGAHPDWGTLVFNYGRHEVKNFLIANALFWLDRYHIDGLRVDAVASMLYLDYSREDGEWVPNRYGGRENLEALEFLKELNSVVHRRFPGAMMIAEESTAWPGVSHSTESGGLGFSSKWNMGWMHDTLDYFQRDPIYRMHHQGQLTFSLLYAFTERFILPFSHDEVVHGKGSMIGKMPGDNWQKFANLRTLLCFMYAHPGKKLLFMGTEIGQWSEWNHDAQLDWPLLDFETHRGIHALTRELNRVYRAEPALWEEDHHWKGFQWIDFSDAPGNVISWIRRGRHEEDVVVCVFNLSPVPRENYRIGVPPAIGYREILNSDAEPFGGANIGNGGWVATHPVPAHGLDHSIQLTLPPLAGLFLKPER